MLKLWALGVFLFLPSQALGAHFPGFLDNRPPVGLDCFRKPLRMARKPAPVVHREPLPVLEPAARPVLSELPPALPEFEAFSENLRGHLRDAVATPPTLEWFLEEIRRPKPEQRIAAMESFAMTGNFAAIPYVSAVLLRLDEEVSVRVSAARALGAIGDARACSFLAQGLKDPASQVRFQAALALGEIKTGRAVRILARSLADPEPVVRAASALALGRLGASTAVVSLMSRALKRERDEGVRAILSWSLERARPS